MAYPPAVPSGARINTTPQVDLHPADHLEIHAALTDIVTVLGSDPAGDAADVTARFALEVPVGVVLPYGGASAPAGWTLCDGTAVSRATYATLFGIIGTSFGVGDGSTTFNVPNLNNRFPVGKGASTWSDALGETGGSADAVAVAHTHTSTDHSHTTTDHSHTYSGTTGGSSQDIVRRLSTGGSGFWTGKDDDGDGYMNTVAFGTGGWALVFTGMHVDYTTDHTHGFSGTTSGATGGTGNTTSGATGGTGNTTASQSPTASGTNANLPPYLTLNFIIRLT